MFINIYLLAFRRRREKSWFVVFVKFYTYYEFGRCTYSCHCCLVAKLSLTHLQPHGLSPPVSSVHGIFPERILEWVAIYLSRDLLNPGIEPMSSVLAGGFFTREVTREVRKYSYCGQFQGTDYLFAPFYLF